VDTGRMRATTTGTRASKSLSEKFMLGGDYCDENARTSAESSWGSCCTWLPAWGMAPVMTRSFKYGLAATSPTAEQRPRRRRGL
jgi:hypothetical protein